MRRPAPALLLALSLVPIHSLAQAQQPRSSPALTSTRSGVMRMRLVKIMDSQGWGEPVEVARLLVPSDWRTEGGVQWVQNMTRCPTNIIQARFRAVSPDGLTGFEIMPQYYWVWHDDPMMQQTMQQSAGNNMACDAVPLMNPPDFLSRMVIPRTRPNARVVGGEPLNSVAQVQQQRLAASYQPLVQQGLMRGYRAEAGRVRLQHQINGQPVEEWLMATIATTATPSASTAALMNGGVLNSANSFTAMAYDIMGTWAPRGQLEQKSKLFGTMMASLRVNPQYTAAVSRWLSNMARIQQEGARDRHRIWREAQEYISNSISQTYRENQVVQDRMAEQFGQTIRGVETYIDPRSNEKVELVGGYKTAWSNGKGEYLLIDTPGFNPAAEFQEDWREMKRPR